MSTRETTYAIRVEREAWDEHDPIPWAYAVVMDEDWVIHRGWAGTEPEAREYAQEWLDCYLRGAWDMSA